MYIYVYNGSDWISVPKNIGIRDLLLLFIDIAF